MSLKIGAMPFPHRECREAYDFTIRHLIPDHLASHLPESYDVADEKLRIIHNEVYQKLR